MTPEAGGTRGSDWGENTTWNKTDWSEAAEEKCQHIELKYKWKFAWKQPGKFNMRAIMLALPACPPPYSWTLPRSSPFTASVWNATFPDICLAHLFISFRSVGKYHTLREIFSDCAIENNAPFHSFFFVIIIIHLCLFLHVCERVYAQTYLGIFLGIQYDCFPLLNASSRRAGEHCFVYYYLLSLEESLSHSSCSINLLNK